MVVLFAVDDQRPDIVSGDEPPHWVGEQRGGYGNPFNVTTTSGKPFAEEVAEAVRRDLVARGFEAVVVEETRDDAEATLRSHGARRGVAVVMRKFNSNTYVNIDVEWDFEATVIGEGGEELATNREEGKRNLEGSFLNPPKAAKQQVPPFFNEIAHRLVAGNKEILEALTSG